MSCFWWFLLCARFSLILGRGLGSRFLSKNFLFFYHFEKSINMSHIKCDCFLVSWQEDVPKNWNVNISIFGALYTIATTKHWFLNRQFAVKTCISLLAEVFIVVNCYSLLRSRPNPLPFFGRLHVTIFCKFLLQNSWLYE